jgi:Holliday junction resolvase
MNLNDPRITELAFRLLPAARELAREVAGETSADDAVLGAVSSRMKQIQDGLSPELEFISAVNWLGRAPAINRIDQTPLPTSYDGAEKFKVPDIVCIASVKDRIVPLLIEVKRDSGTKLVWTEKYISALRSYAEKLNLPLLVAWKYRHIWTLTDSRRFEKKVQSYHLDWMTALKENLMSYIFGDELIELTDRVSFYLDAEITNGGPLPQSPDLMPEGQYSTKLDGAGFLLDDKPTKISNELTWLFFRASAEHVVRVTSEKTVRVTYTPEPETMFSLTDFALMLLLWDEADAPDWEAVVRKEIPISAATVRNELEKGIKAGVVRYILLQQPTTVPDFLP